jgi:hypothetical protein
MGRRGSDSGSGVFQMVAGDWGCADARRAGWGCVRRAHGLLGGWSGCGIGHGNWDGDGIVHVMEEYVRVVNRRRMVGLRGGWR